MSASKRKSTTLMKAVRLLTYALENKVSLRQAAKDLRIDDKYVRKIRSSFKDRKDPDYVKFLRLYDEFHKQSGLKVDSSLYNKREFKKIADELKTYRRFFITTASADHCVSMPSLNAAKRYCRENNAALIVLPANWAINQIDPVLRDDPDVFFVYDDMRLNDNLRISAIRISPKQIDPVTGLDRLGQRDGSFIFASPKQRLKYVATSNANLPHCLMTTGAITLPQYNGKYYRELRLDEIARHDHVMGGIVVEIESDQIFHFRQVQFNSRGAFIDFGVEYHADYSKQAPAAAMVLGDLHCADLDKEAYSQSISMIKDLNPKYLVLHDVFDGKSISHWTREKKVYRAAQFSQGFLSLKDEIKSLVEILNELADTADKIVIVKSNHDEFLDRYLEDGRYIKEPYNYAYAAQIVANMVQGKDPLQWACEDCGLEQPEKFMWLRREDDFKIAGIQLGAHGDKGGNGAKGSTRLMESGYGDSISGHCHTPEILRSAWRVGTLSILNPDYTKGAPSSWFHCNAVLYPNGMRQLINIINNGYKLRK